MHVLNLPDAYEEVVLGVAVNAENGTIVHPGDGNVANTIFLPNYNCRVTQSNSIMVLHWQRFTNVANGKDHSLLDPVHFNAILYGNCPSRDDIKLYRQCSSLSYMTRYNGTEDDCPPEK